MKRRRRAARPVGRSAANAPRRPRAVLFDLDGTLLDSTDLIIASVQDAVREIVGTIVDRRTILASWSRPVRDGMRLLAPGREDELVQAYLRRYMAQHDEYVRLFPGVPEVLHTLCARGYALAIVTSKRRSTTQAALDAFDLRRWCAAVVVDEDTERHKPAPDPVLLAAERLGVAPRDALMVGDTSFDIEAGRGAGAATAAALWGTADLDGLIGAAPDFRLERPATLLEFCPPA